MFESAFYLRGFRYETATLVEHSAVNRVVVGSSPTGGAWKARKFNVYGLYLCNMPLGGKIDRLLKKAGIRLLTEK